MEMSKRQYENLLFAISVALAIFRFSYLGLRYIPYLDDYIQYFYYPQLRDNWQRVYSGGAGVLFTRPLAGLFDFIIWSKFGNNLGIAVGIISILYGLSAAFFYKAFNLCGLRVGILFIVLYLLMPANCEATYWLSASSRIVVSVFFVSLCAYFGAVKKMILFSVFNFLSLWFYEQTAILSFVISIWVCIRKKKLRWISVPAASLLLLAAYYLKFGFLGDNAHRMQQLDLSKILQNTMMALRDFLKILTQVQLKLITKGFARGFTQLALDFSLLWLICLTVLSILFWRLSQKCDTRKKLSFDDMVWGVIFMLLPVSPFFVLGAEGFNMRNIAPCAPGLAIILDRGISKLPHKYICLISAIAVFWFSIVSVSEVVDYNTTAKQDLAVVSKIADSVTAETDTVSVRNTLPEYYPQNAPFRDHIISATGSDWGLTGLVRTISKNEKVVVINNN